MSDLWKPEFAQPLGPWFRWFAWHPTYTVDRGWRWLRLVWRRPCQDHDWSPRSFQIWFQTVVGDPRKS